MKKLPLAHIELSKENLVTNIEQLRNFTKKGTRFVSVIKANAYGHGQAEVVKILNQHTEYFGINSINELQSLRKVSNKKTLVLGYVEETDLPEALKLGCILSIFSFEQLVKVSRAAKKINKIQEINIAIDAHLGREGILLEELPQFLETFKKSKNLKLFGVYAHFANIEDSADFSHAQKQIDTYEKALRIFEQHSFKNFYTHISATSGIMAYESDKGLHDIVRAGVGLCGLWPSEGLQKKYGNKIKLQPVLSWKTKIAQIKTLPAGSSIGYGLSYVTSKKTKIAVIPQGYSDGFDRNLSNKGEVLISGTRCKVLGRVMMNMFVVDVNHLKKVQAEDEVVIIGAQGKEKITAEEIANKIGTINYEITTRISSLLPRIIG